MNLMKFSWQTSKLRTNVHGRSCNQVNHSGTTIGRWKLFPVTGMVAPEGPPRVCVSGAGLDLQKSQKCARDCSKSLIDLHFTSLHFTSFVHSFIRWFIHSLIQPVIIQSASQSFIHSILHAFLTAFFAFLLLTHLSSDSSIQWVRVHLMSWHWHLKNCLLIYWWGQSFIVSALDRDSYRPLIS